MYKVDYVHAKGFGGYVEVRVEDQENGSLSLWSCLSLSGRPSYQIYKLMGGNTAREDAGRMLYEVAAFQMGLVQNALNEAAAMENMSQLVAVKLAIYSANYTHDRMVKAYDNDHLKRLASLNKLLEFIRSVQIAGDRSLHEEEKSILQEGSEALR